MGNKERRSTRNVLFRINMAELRRLLLEALTTPYHIYVAQEVYPLYLYMNHNAFCYGHLSI
jgi:hypothetical protein